MKVAVVICGDIVEITISNKDVQSISWYKDMSARTFHRYMSKLHCHFDDVHFKRIL